MTGHSPPAVTSSPSRDHGKLCPVFLLVSDHVRDSATTFSESHSKPAADLIITNAKVWTVDACLPMARAITALGDRIVSVGSNATIDAWRGPHTEVIDASGKLLLPGFNDAHVHFV